MPAENLMHRFHQSPVSRTVKKIPGVSQLAQKWWLGSQESVFRSAMNGMALPKVPADPEAPVIDIPTFEEIRDQDARTVAMGDEFSREMAQWCQTSKFDSLGYHDIYGRIFTHLRTSAPRVLEVGIGVNDPGAASGMISTHKPGASLVGWANYFPGAEVNGADIDRRVLIDTDLYSTHYVDQRSATTLEQLATTIGSPLDVVVDDGLHTAEANGLTVAALLPHLSSRGVLVVEDILPEYDELWTGLPGWLNPAYQVSFYPGSILRSNRPEGIAVFTRSR